MRRLLFLVLILSSAGAWAEEYYWIVASFSHSRASTAQQSCDLRANYRLSDLSNGTRYENNLVPTSPNGGSPRFICNNTIYAISENTGDEYRYGSYSDVTTRRGDSCPDGTEYNPATGSCDQDCSETIGQNLLVRGPNSPVFNSNGKNYVLASANDVDGTCTSNCRYDSISSFAGSCYLVAGSTDTGYCNYIVTGTGDSCSAHNLTPGDMSGDPLNAPDPGDGGGDGGDPDEPDQPDPCHGVPGYTWNGSTCVNTGGGDGDGDGDGSGDGDGGGGGPGDGAGNNGGGDGGGDGDGDGNGDGDGGGPGGGGGNGGDGDGDCEGEDCGPGAGQPGLAEFGEDVGGFGDSLDGFMDRISESPLLESLNSIGSSTPQGNCSIATVRVWFFDFDAGAIFCDMAPGLIAPLYPLFLAIWAFAAVRILFSA